ncbi:MAG: hypothetical protein R3C58_14560 [Parvularculaceae bacterium]
MIRKVLLAAAVLPLAACSATDLATTTQRLRQADQAAKVATGVAATVSPEEKQTAPDAVTLASAAPISAEAIETPLKKIRGKESIVNQKPRIAIAGYNVAAITKSRSVATSMGTLTRSGAKTSMTMLLEGVDDALLTEIADAAYADLVAQFAAEGIDVAPLSEITAADADKKIFPGEAAFNGDLQRGNGDGKVRVAGVSGAGVSNYAPVGRITFGGNGAVKPAGALDAVMLFPNLCLGFAQTSGSGTKMFGSSARVEGGAMFSVDPASKVEAVYSNGRFLDGWATWGLKETIGVADAFAEVSKTGSSNNALAVGLSSALGTGMGANSKSEYTVVADRERYKALALKAAKGMNAALVAEVVAARSGS